MQQISFKPIEEYKTKKEGSAYKFQDSALRVIHNLNIKVRMQPKVFKAFNRNEPKAEAAYRISTTTPGIKNKAGYFLTLIASI